MLKKYTINNQLEEENAIKKEAVSYGLDVQITKKDVFPFIKDGSKLNLWSKEFFNQITENLN